MGVFSFPAVAIIDSTATGRSLITAADQAAARAAIGVNPLASANILVGNGSNVPTAVAVSGDVTITNAGAVAIGNDKITAAMIGDNVLNSEHYAAASIDNEHLADNAVGTDEIADDAVTADKLANSINSAIAANTSKTSNATHTGDVTGSTTLTIANDAVDIAMLSATGTASSSTFLRGDNAWVTPTDTTYSVGDGGLTTNDFTNADHSKLNGIEASATADQTDAEIRAAVEAATDSNVFTDADHTKLNGIEASATADQTNAEIRTAVEAASDSNVFTDADHTKLNGIAASANNYVHPNHSGDVVSSADGAMTIQTDAVDIAMLSATGTASSSTFLRGDNAWATPTASVDIDALDALGGAGLHQTADHFIFSDGGTEKKITFSNLQDAVFADVSGQATIAAGGALTIANDTIDSAHYAAGSIDNEHLADDAVDSDELAAGAVDLAHMSDNSVDSDQYVDLSIDTAHIGNLQVTTGKIANLAIATGKIANLGVTTGKIDNLAVTTGKIAADAVTGAQIADNAINSEHYTDGSIDTAHIGDNQVTADKLAHTDVTAGNYTSVDITVDAQGRITAAANGSGGGGVSDMRLKDDISNLENSLDRVMKIFPKSFVWKDGYNNVHNNKGKDIGFLAQEVEIAEPTLVGEHMDYKTVEYLKFVPLLVGAIQELNNEIKNLKKSYGNI